MRLRSLLFVPGDRPERFAKATASGADAIILDLEDSVAPANKAAAREAVVAFLAKPPAVTRLVRVNPLGSADLKADLAAARGADALVLPKAEGAQSIDLLLGAWGEDCPPVLPIATETPAALFALAEYRQCAGDLLGLTWGAEDLPAAIGAEAARDGEGRYLPPYELARSLALFAAHAAGVTAIETVFPAIADTDGLRAYAERGRRDGFTGMLAIHPAQVPVINAAFTPAAEAIARARRIVDAFAAAGTGVVQLDGAMLDAPHLKQAQALLARACDRIDRSP